MHSTKDRPVEITPQMVDAGVRELCGYDFEYDVQSEVVIGIYLAMVPDFAQWTHPVSSDWTHLAWVTGGAAGDEFYASFLRKASFLALTPR